MILLLLLTFIGGVRVERFPIEETRYIGPAFLDSTLHVGFTLLDSIPGGDVTLTWTAVGDDGYSGTAVGYDFQYGRERSMPTHLILEPAKPSGERETLTLILEPNSGYYFAVRAYDEVPNYGDTSNVVYKVTAPTWYEQIQTVIDTAYLEVRTYPDSVPVPDSIPMFGTVGISVGHEGFKNLTTLHISPMRRKDLSMNDMVDLTDLAMMIHYLTVSSKPRSSQSTRTLSK